MAKGSKESGGKTVKDMKNGKAVDDHQVPIDGKTEGDNSFNPSGETLSEYLDECARIEDEAELLKEKMATKCEPERAAMKKGRKHIETMEKKLAGDGYNLKSLQTIKRQHLLRHRADKAVNQLDEGQARAHKRMLAAWKDFSTLPLGQAAEARDAQPVH